MMLGGALAFALLVQPEPRVDEQFIGYLTGASVVREEVMTCNGERYVITIESGTLSAVRSPWGVVNQSELIELRSAVAETLLSISRVELLCNADSFAIDLYGLPGPASAAPPGQFQALTFWFQDGRLVPSVDGGRQTDREPQSPAGS